VSTLLNFKPATGTSSQLY